MGPTNDASDSRRSFLRTLGVSLAVGSTAFAGCGTPDNGSDEPYVPTEPNYQGWFENVSNYRGTVDARGQRTVGISVGVQGANGYYYYGPAAVAVSPGTTVVWTWTGRGGTHNCVSTSGAFTSGRLVDDAGYTFEWTAERPGVYRYYCSPHQSLGMKGAVFVALGGPGEPT